MTHHEKSKIFYALLYFFLLTVSLYFFRCLSAVYYLPACLSVCFSVLLSVCLSVSLSACVPVYAGVSYYERSIFDIPNRRSPSSSKSFEHF